MKVTWLGSSALLFENENIKILVDPLFSDIDGKVRRYPSDKSYLELSPDVIILSGTDKERLDMSAVSSYIRERGDITVLASEGAYMRVSEMCPDANIVLLSPHSVWSEGGVTFYSVGCAGADRTAIGVIVDDGEMTYYLSGATLYNYDVLDDVLDLAPDGVDYAFLPISGRGSVMNAKDAADFAYEISAKRAVPVSYGLYDDVSASDFDFEDAVVLEPYCEYELDK